ncbi:immunoglobulin delta heavy chain-like [Sapajus apella]|uniref:immunoglobulin delta heavy chain-like n=1 Tax=Sapajus apella TaxID=9515 RepID=UPI00137AAF0E|nr:immunoglobulin delta heavy chain-like [Sapajus apella]
MLCYWYFDVWGSGTLVTVSSGSTRSPDVFPITSACQLPKNDSSVALACLITGYNPKPVSVTWYLGTQIQLQRSFPEAQGKAESYTTSSQLSTPVPLQHQSKYKCVVWHVPSNNSTEKTFRRPESWKAQSPSVSTTPPQTPPQAEGSPSKASRIPAATRNTAAQAPVKLSLNLLASSAPPEVASWLLCKVSGFSPPDVLLTWLQDQHEVNPSWFATAHPAPQPGSTTFQAWSVLRVPAPPSPQPATYMCKVHHKASQTLLNASLSLDVSYLATTPPIPQSEDENSDDYPPADDVGSLWTTLSTFVALFVLTLLYSGIVTFIKVK